MGKGTWTIHTRYFRQLFVHTLLEISFHPVKMCHMSNHTVKIGKKQSKICVNVRREGIEQFPFSRIKCAIFLPQILYYSS